MNIITKIYYGYFILSFAYLPWTFMEVFFLCWCFLFCSGCSELSFYILLMLFLKLDCITNFISLCITFFRKIRPRTHLYINTIYYF